MARYLTPDDVAERLHVCRRTALDLMKRDMRCINTGKGTTRPRWVVDEMDFNRWAEGRKQVPVLIRAEEAPKKGRRAQVVPMFLPTAGPIPYRHTGKKASGK